MLDYDREAARYDRTRGGRPRARAAASAVHELIMTARPSRIAEKMIMDEMIIDAAGGTGIVSAELARLGWRTLVLDLSPGMLRHAHDRLPGRGACADATRLPLADGTGSIMIMLWLLHLLPDAAPVITEAARALRPGGLVITTVDKNTAGGPADPDATDGADRVDGLCADHGLVRAAATTFVGHGQGRDGRPDPVYPLVAHRRT